MTRGARLSRPPAAGPGHSPPRVTAWPATSPGKCRLRTVHTWTWQVSVFCCIQLPANCHWQTSKTEIIGLSFYLLDSLKYLLSFLNQFIIIEDQLSCREGKPSPRQEWCISLQVRTREQNMLSEISHPSASHRIMLSNGDSQKRFQDLSRPISNINFILTNRFHSHCSVYECPQVDIYSI